MLPLFMITTNDTKFAHIEHLCSLQTVELIRLPYGFTEIQDNNMRRLLRSSIENIFFAEKNRVFFLIEQTSVFLKAFSKNGEGPGFFFKDWWQSKGKDELRNIAREDPRARIESGVALNIPGHEPLIFINKQLGSVTLDGYVLEENKQYSWLSSNDFNLYFVPKGANRVYDAMKIQEFLKYDFRKPNIDKVCQRLGEYSSIISETIQLEEIELIAEKYQDKKASKEFKQLRLKQ